MKELKYAVFSLLMDFYVLTCADNLPDGAVEWIIQDAQTTWIFLIRCAGHISASKKCMRHLI